MKKKRKEKKLTVIRSRCDNTLPLEATSAPYLHFCQWVNKPITWKQAWAVSEIGNSFLKNSVLLTEWTDLKSSKQCLYMWAHVFWVNSMFIYVGPSNFGLWVNKLSFVNSVLQNPNKALYCHFQNVSNYFLYTMELGHKNKCKIHFSILLFFSSTKQMNFSFLYISILPSPNQTRPYQAHMRALNLFYSLIFLLLPHFLSPLHPSNQPNRP